MKQREIHLDLLRIIAMFTVILVHCSRISEKVPQVEVRTLYSVFCTLYTWEVPVFVMISGRFFLDPQREITGAKLKRAIVRILLAFLFWNVLYQAYYLLSGSYASLNWKGVFSQTLEGPYHFWFLFMIVGLYLITPFLRQIAGNKRLTEYFLLLFLLAELFDGYLADLPVIGSGARAIGRSGAVSFVTGFSGYYLLGYYLHKYAISRRGEVFLYCIGALFAITATLGTLRKWYPQGADPEYYIKYLKPNIIIVASAVYVFFRKRVAKHCFSKKTAHLIVFLSEHSFGIYLIHALVVDLLWNVRLFVAQFLPWMALPEYAFRVFLISLAVAFLIRKIPIFGRMIT